jgi:hypothetical protein
VHKERPNVVSSGARARAKDRWRSGQTEIERHAPMAARSGTCVIRRAFTSQSAADAFAFLTEHRGEFRAP